uniref:Uncharacterized protein n=1 Tax=Glossina austeni TaxID=7395 RepID=A0A1A9VAW3_GLOAU
MNYRQTLYSAEFQQPPHTAHLDQHEHLCQHRFQCSRNPQVMHPHICHHHHRHKVQNVHQHQYPCAHEVPCVHQIPCLYQPELQNRVCACKCKSNKTDKRTKAERSRYSTSTKTLTNTRASNTTSSASISMATSSRASKNVETQPSVRRDSLTSTSNNARVKVRNHSPENSLPVPARSVIDASTPASPHSTIQKPAHKSTSQYAPPLAPTQATAPKYATDRKSTHIASTPSRNTIVNVSANQKNKQAPGEHYAVSKNTPTRKSLTHYALTSAETNTEEPNCTEIAESLLGLMSVSSLKKNLEKACKARPDVQIPNYLPPVPPQQQQIHATIAPTLQAQKYALSSTATPASIPAPESQDFHLRDPSTAASKYTLMPSATTTPRHASTPSAPHLAAIPSQNPSVKYTSLPGPKYLPASLAAQTYVLTSAPQNAPSPAPASVSSLKVDSRYLPERGPKHQPNPYQLHEEYKH